MARLHEYQGKAILAANGFKVPRGRAASSPDEDVNWFTHSYWEPKLKMADCHFSGLQKGETPPEERLGKSLFPGLTPSKTVAL
jgi:hypothetical protein